MTTASHTMRRDVACPACGDLDGCHLWNEPPMSERMTGEHISQFFAFDHLPPHLQVISRPFGELAQEILKLPRNPERTVALRKLLESKDAAVRAVVAKKI